jgi:membrane protease YdiL (CAAX protease family)
LKLGAEGAMTTVGHTMPNRRAAGVSGFVHAHPLAAYFALTFAISWGGVLAVVGRSGIPGTREQIDALMAPAVMAMLLGPPVAGIALTAIVHGTPGLRELLSRLMRWRVGARWYAIALLTAPVLTIAALLALSLRSRAYLPGILTGGETTSRLLFAAAIAAGAGIFEEIGWTGFATPELRRRRSVLATGITIGALWGAWHLLVNFWGSGDATGSLDSGLILSSLVASLGTLPAYRVLMVRVYDRTGSLLVAMLMHLSLTVCTLVLQPQAAGLSLLTFTIVLAALMWVVAAVRGMR